MVDEVLLRPKRLTAQGLEEYERGNHPKALEAFEGAVKTRPTDPTMRFNVADALYKNGKFDEAAVLYQALAEDESSPLAAKARFNLGNTRYQKEDFPGAVEAYREALRLTPGDPDTTWNLELALRALQEQERQKKREQERQQQEDQDQEKQDQQGEQQQGQDQKQQDQEQQQQKEDQSDPKQSQRPKTKEEKERERFQKEAGMPKERAMQLLDALQQNEKAEQRKLLAAQRAKVRKGKDW
jgi:Ca-activated chloride channel family protein